MEHCKLLMVPDSLRDGVTGSSLSWLHQSCQRKGRSM